MEGNLLDLSTRELLKKFGVGSHKPGSGSAAALQGILSANLIRTVITLTTEEKRRSIYGPWCAELSRRNDDIINRIMPKLESLFAEDSVQFDKVIALRTARDKEKELSRKGELEAEHLDALKAATEIPVEIGNLCSELAEICAFVFENGFQAARGDSSVALNGAVSAILGCIAIVELNLISFRSDTWTGKVRNDVRELRQSYWELYELSMRCSSQLQKEADKKEAYSREINELISANRKRSWFSDADIETCARELQVLIWKNRNMIWKNGGPDDPLEILNPGSVFKKLLGYQFHKAKAYGTERSEDETAGIINQTKKFVYISNRFPDEIQNFTAAHELGHALMHSQAIMHRDRPLDGSETGTKSSEEYQADKFASYFLMPSKMVIGVFEESFGMSRFAINHDNAFKLNRSGPNELKESCKNLRGLSRKLASAGLYGATEIVPMHKVFNVSVEAMAIRLEELDLVVEF